MRFPSPTLPPASASTLTNPLHWSPVSRQMHLGVQRTHTHFFESRGSNGDSCSKSEIHWEDHDLPHKKPNRPKRNPSELDPSEISRPFCHSSCILFTEQNGSRHCMGSDTSGTPAPSVSTSDFIHPLSSKIHRTPARFLFCFREADKATLRAREAAGQGRSPLSSLGRAHQVMPEGLDQEETPESCGFLDHKIRQCANNSSLWGIRTTHRS